MPFNPMHGDKCFTRPAIGLPVWCKKFAYCRESDDEERPEINSQHRFCTARCTIAQSAVLRLHVVRQSASDCLSLCM